MGKTYTEVGSFEVYNLPEYKIYQWGKYQNYNTEFLLLDSDILDETITFKIEFLGDVGLLYNNKLSFSINVMTREGKYFNKSVFQYNDIRKDKLNLNIFELKLSNSKIKFDNEYIFKLTYNLINEDNTISPIQENTSKYIDGMASENNGYLTVLKNVDKPELSIGSFSEPNISGLKNKSIVTDKKIRSLALDFDFIGSLIISIDGVTMSEYYDYERKDKVIIFNEALPKGTVISISGFSKDDSKNGFNAESYLVYSNAKTPTKENVKEGVFYDKANNKFGVALKKGISNTSEPILILNGQQLLFNSDFFVDPNENSMVLLSGLLLEEDIITVYYIPEFVTNEIIDNKLFLNITLNNPITNEDGYFELQISSDKTFKEFENVIIDYVDGQGVYVFDLEYHSKGLKYIKVVNIKQYELINTKQIKMTKESKTIKLLFK